MNPHPPPSTPEETAVSTDHLTEPDTIAVFARGTVVELVRGPAMSPTAEVEAIHPATVRVTRDRVFATDGRYDWTWLVDDLREVLHSPHGDWTILNVSDVEDFGIQVSPEDRDSFRAAIDAVAGGAMTAATEPVVDLTVDAATPAPEPVASTTEPESYDPTLLPEIDEKPAPVVSSVFSAPTEPAVVVPPRPITRAAVASPRPGPVVGSTIGLPEPPATTLKGLDAREISAWFGDHQVLDRVSLNMMAGHVTALIGPSGCGKSTFLRILNRMHEMIPGAAMAGEVLLAGEDVYDPQPQADGGAKADRHGVPEAEPVPGDVDLRERAGQLPVDRPQGLDRGRRTRSSSPASARPASGTR